MKTLKLLVAALLAVSCPVSSFAQKSLKNVRNIAKVSQSVKPDLSRALQDKISVVGASTQLVKQVPVVSMPVVAKLPEKFRDLHFLTGPQTLQTFMPAWRTDLRTVFTPKQLDLIEQTFADTDAVLFKVDAQGNWIAAQGTDWEYSNWFSELLTEKGSFSQAQLKSLFGRHARLGDVFTRLNQQSFIAVNQRIPKEYSGPEERNLARRVKYNIQKRIEQEASSPEGEKAISEQEIVLFEPAPVERGQYAPSRSAQEWLKLIKAFIEKNHRWPSVHRGAEERNLYTGAYSVIRANSKDPDSIALKRLWNRYRPRFNSPQDWLDIIKPWVEKNQRWPKASGEEDQMYQGAETSIIHSPNHPASIELKKLREQYVTKKNTPQDLLAWAQLWAEEKGRWFSSVDEEEKKMYESIRIAIQAHPDDPAAQELQELWHQYKRETKSPQDWLEIAQDFVTQNGRWFSSTIEGESATYQSIASVINRYPEDPACIALTQLWNPYKAVYKTPQDWLDLIKQWLKEYDRWPSQWNSEENALYQGVKNIIARYPDDPACIELKKLWAPYQRPKHKTPQQWLEEVKPWVEKQGRWFSTMDEEENKTNSAINAVIRRHPEDPACIELKKLREQYNKRKLSQK